MTLEHFLARDRVLPLFTPDDLGVARGRLNILQTAGIGMVELTARAPGTLEHFKTLQTEFPDLLLGAGTILTAADAHAFLDAGATFLVSPCLVLEVAAAARERGVPYLPGAGTVREYVEARDAGCGLVKLFPGEVLGLPFVRALTGPFPDAQVVVTGGVEATHAGVAAWLDAGALAVGLGSRLFGGSGELGVRLSALLKGSRMQDT